MLDNEKNLTQYRPPEQISIWAGVSRLLRWVAQNLFYSDYHRWVLWVPVLLAIGIGFYFSLKSEPHWYTGGLFLAGSIALMWWFRRSPFIFLSLLALGIGVLGFTAAQVRTLRMSEISLQREIGPVSVSGHILNIELLPNGSRVLLDNLHIDGHIEAPEIPRKARIRINSLKGDPLQPGDWIKMYAVLRPPFPPSSPHAFDFQRYAFFKGIGAIGFSYGAATVIQSAQVDATTPSFELLQSKLRQSVGDRIRASLPGETGMLATALITGDKKAIPEVTVEAMRDAGLAHLLAISGLHIGLVAGLVFFMVRAVLALHPIIAVKYNIKAWAAVIALIAALGYSILAGSTIPTLRAFTMMALVLGAIMIDRRGITLRLVAMAAIVILLFQPESLLGPSFQLSFAAVTGLVACYEAIKYNKQSRVNRGNSGIWGRKFFYSHGSLYGRYRAFHNYCRNGDSPLCSLSFSPISQLRWHRKSRRYSHHSPLDYAQCTHRHGADAIGT